MSGRAGLQVGKVARKAALLALLAALVVLLAAGSLVRAQELSWFQMAPSPAPPSRVGQAMAYDAGSDRVILFGGSTSVLSNVPYGDTWAYDLNTNTWENRDPNPAPSPRFVHAMAYEEEADLVLLYGGWTGTAPSSETWAYDYETNTWTNLTPASAPTAATYVDMAYDAESGVTILFGGGRLSTHTAQRNETWAYDLDQNMWTQRSPADSPIARATNGVMAYDPAADRVVLFGGLAFLDDTWEYDYNADVWTRTSPEAGPPSRHAGAMAYDASVGRVVLFGGVTTIPPGHDDTWLYDTANDTWSQLEEGDGPSKRWAAGLVYDSESGASVLFGGSAGGGETWSLRPDPSPPGPIPWLYIGIGGAAGAAAVIVFLFLRRRRPRRLET